MLVIANPSDGGGHHQGFPRSLRRITHAYMLVIVNHFDHGGPAGGDRRTPVPGERGLATLGSGMLS